MDANSKLNNIYPKIKKYLITAITLLSITTALLTILMFFKTNISFKETHMQQETHVSAASTTTAPYYYALWRTLSEKGMQIGNTKITHLPTKATHYINPSENLYIGLGELNNENNALKEEDTYIPISSESDYKFIASLTHQYQEKEIVVIETTDGHKKQTHAMIKTNKYYYSFKYSEVQATVHFVKVQGRWYRFFPIGKDEIKSLQLIRNVKKTDDSSSIKTDVYKDVQLKVVLTNDITVTLSNSKKTQNEKENLEYFDGIFDGQGHTINFTGTDTFDEEWVLYCEGFQIAYSSFCAYNAGTIKNVKLNYQGMDSLFLAAGTEGVTYAGGIVGHNKGVVESCIVYSPSVKSNRYNSNAYYGALSGINDGTIQYCMVDGTYSLYAHTLNFASNVDGINAYWGTAKGANVVKYCLWKANVVENKAYFKDMDYILSPADVEKKFEAGKQLTYSYSGHEDSSNCYDTFAYSGSIENNAKAGWAALKDISEVGGKTGTAWYHVYDEYEKKVVYDTYPILRAFINWEKLTITVNDSNLGSVSRSELWIPGDVGQNKPCGLHDQKATVSIVGNSSYYTVLGESVSAYPKDKNSRVEQWTISTDRRLLTAHFGVDCMVFKIDSSNVSSSLYNWTMSGSDKNYIPQFYIANQESVSIRSDRLSKFNCHSSITIEFDSYTQEKNSNNATTYKQSNHITIVFTPIDYHVFSGSINDTYYYSYDDTLYWYLPSVHAKSYNVTIR